MPSEQIQWFPGHMAKTRRMISENLKNVDIIIEILDARIPFSSRNPEIKRLTEGKPTLVLLNKASLADPNQNALWMKRYTNENTKCILTDCVTGEGLNKMEGAIKEILADKLRRYEEKGKMGRRVRAMVLGVPNVSPSSVDNAILTFRRLLWLGNVWRAISHGLPSTVEHHTMYSPSQALPEIPVVKRVSEG